MNPTTVPVQLRIVDQRLLAPDFFPTYGTPGSAGLDLRACIEEPLVLEANEWKLVSSGIHVYLGNPGLAGMILPRSGLGHKKGLVIGNLVGVIDSDYQGALMMSLWNRSDVAVTVQPLERVAQYLIVPVLQAEFTVVDSFDTVSERGEGGFGHTGT